MTGCMDRVLDHPVTDSDSSIHRPNWGKVLMATAAVGGIGLLAAVGHSILASSLATLAHIDWTWMGVAVLAELASMRAFARTQGRLLRAGGGKIRFRSCLAVTYAGNALSVSVPLVGPEMATAFEFRQFNKHGIDSAVAGWALALSGIMSSAALGVVFIVGGLASGSVMAALLGFAAAIVMLVPMVAVLVALRFSSARRFMVRLIGRLLAATRRRIKRPRPGAEASVEQFLDRLVTLHLSSRQYMKVFGLALWNWIADVLCLAAALKATGVSVPWTGLLLAYAAAMTAGSIGLTPGGLGVIEAALTAALVAAGLNAHHALGGVLAYRLISFWIVMATGWAYMAWLTNRSQAKHAESSVSALPRQSRTSSGPEGFASRQMSGHFR
jgi:uncharacterized protein (TIRG00374 family)